MLITDKSQASSSVVSDDSPPPYSIPQSTRERTIVSEALVNQLHLHTRRADITGSFLIDPLGPRLDGKHMDTHKPQKKPLPDASYRSRKGNIILDLATRGSVVACPKASVAVETRSGDILVNLLPNSKSNPHIGLDITSRRGNISLFIPDTFAGVLRLSTRRGDLKILHGLSQIMRVLKSTDREMLVMIGEISGPTDALTREADLCQAYSRKGTVTVGLRGVDQIEQKTGFWKKVGQLLKGEEDSQ